MHDNIEDYIGYIIKLKIWFGKISDTMIGIWIQLEYNWKGGGDFFVWNWRFSSNRCMINWG